MKAKSSSSPRTSRASLPPPTHDQIQQRAHRLWIEAGRPDGLHREHWQEAERQLRDPSYRRDADATETRAEIEADKRVDGLGPPNRDPRTPSGERL